MRRSKLLRSSPLTGSRHAASRRSGRQTPNEEQGREALRPAPCAVRAGNVMAPQRQQRGRGSGGGGLRFDTVLLLALALLSLCLARAGAVAAPSASLAGAAPALDSEHGVATALENALTQEEVSRGHSTAAAEEDEGDGDVVPERVAMESTEDYDFPSANRKHAPHP